MLSCPLLDNSCSRGYAIAEEDDDWYACDDCCGSEEEEVEIVPACSTCTAHRLEFAETMGLEGKYGRHRRRHIPGRTVIVHPTSGMDDGGSGDTMLMALEARKGGDNARGRANRGSGGGRSRSVSPSPVFRTGGGSTVVAPIVRSTSRGSILSPVIAPLVRSTSRGSIRLPPILGGGSGRRRRTGGGGYFFPGTFAALGLAGLSWFAPYRRRYSNWYPSRAVPLYVYNRYGSNNINPDLSGLGEYPDISLPSFYSSFNLADYANRQTLTQQQQSMVEAELERINTLYGQLLVQLAADNRYQYWVQRGFKVVPDLSQSRFVWVYAGVLPGRTITQYLGSLKLSCSACGGHGGELKELAKLTHESIVFDIRGKDEDEIFKGFFISKDGNVYAYHITHDHENPLSTQNTTVVELIPGKQVSPEEMQRLTNELVKLSRSEFSHNRRHTGPLRYDGFVNYKRIHIYGDDDSQSPIADEIVRSIQAIIA